MEKYESSIKASRIITHWKCQDCSTEIEWALCEIVQNGTPECTQCDGDMDLLNKISITRDTEDGEFCQLDNFHDMKEER